MVLVRPTVKRDALLEVLVKLPSCLIGLEACSGAHQWAREYKYFLQGKVANARARSVLVTTPVRMMSRPTSLRDACSCWSVQALLGQYTA